MFGLSFLEILVIAVGAFLVFGPERFPLMLKKIVRIIKTFKDLGTHLQREILENTQKIENEIKPIELSEMKDEIQPFISDLSTTEDKKDVDSEIQKSSENHPSGKGSNKDT